MTVFTSLVTIDNFKVGLNPFMVLQINKITLIFIRKVYNFFSLNISL